MKPNENDVVRLKPYQQAPLEEKIYVNWAFTDRAPEKAKINLNILEKLKQNLHISYNYKNKDNPDFDLVLSTSGQSGCTKYDVYRNSKNLSADEIALIVDDGNLCFGYSGTECQGRIWID